MSRRRTWLFRIAAAIIIPAAVFGLIELGLRLGGYGFATAYFIAAPVEGRLCGNPRFGWRFFPPAIAREPLTFTLDADKAPDAFRIFVLGSSAAQGFPEPAFGFPRMIEVMLRDACPGVRLEVVNTAMIAINSHVVREIAADCAGLAPDLFIVYEGNNEVVGPFGPGTVFTSAASSARGVRMRLALGRTRLMQLAQSLGRRFAGGEGHLTEWKGLEFFQDRPVAADDPRIASVYASFRDNLLDICRSARGVGAEVLLCTVGVNLRDCAPFASAHRPDLPEGDLRRWDALFREAVALEAAGQHAAARPLYEAALEIDDRHAELHFRLARCLLAADAFEASARQFSLARDLDALRLRTDSSLNAIIRDAASAAGDGVRLVDIERLMADADPAAHGVPGRELFHEHCHMTFAGNFLIARALAEQVLPMLEARRIRRTSSPATLPSRERCAELLGYTELHEYNLLTGIADLLEHPPFSATADVAEQRARILREIDTLRPALSAEALARQADTTRRAVAACPNDPVLRKLLAGILTRAADHAGAAEQIDAALRLVPFDCRLRLEYGGLLVAQGILDAARREYEAVLASEFCNRRTRSDAHFSIGVVCERQARPEDAKSHYLAALEASPSHVQANGNLGLLFANQGDFARAVGYQRRAVAADPTVARSHLNLAIALVRAGRLDEAVEAFRGLLTVSPGEASAHAAIGDIRLKQGRVDEAIAEYRRGLAAAPGSAELHFSLGKALARRGQQDEARSHLLEALRLKPDHAGARAAIRDLGSPENPVPRRP